MKKYKCNSCGNEWEAIEAPFECPKCRESYNSISEVGTQITIWATLKKYWWVIAGAALLAIVALLAIPSRATRVSVDANQEMKRMVITLHGKHAKEYMVILKQSGNIAQSGLTSESNPVIFNDLMGKYTLEVMYVGQGETPPIRSFKSEYEFLNSNTGDGGGTDSISKKPEIDQLDFNPKRIAQGKTYTVTVKLSSRSCPANLVEFSTDGTHWQTSPEFTKLEAGEYVFYARRKEKNLHDLCTQRELVLQEAPASKKCVTPAELNALIEQMGSGDNDASDRARSKFKRIVGNSTPVLGVADVQSVNELVTDIVSMGNPHTVVEVDCEEGVLNSITIN